MGLERAVIKQPPGPAGWSKIALGGVSLDEAATMRRRTVAAPLLVGISGMVGCADETLPEPMPKPASLPSPECGASVLWLPEGATTRERGFRASPVRVENGRETYEDGTAYVAFEFTGEC
jgi:hypothetical protein